MHWLIASPFHMTHADHIILCNKSPHKQQPHNQGSFYLFIFYFWPSSLEPHELISLRSSSMLHPQILPTAPWIDCPSCILHHRVSSPTNCFPSTVRLSSTLKSYPEPHEVIVIHESSTIESGTPRIDCLALFIYPPPSNIIRCPTKTKYEQQNQCPSNYRT